MRRHPWVTAAIAVFLLCAILFFCVEWRAEKRWQRYAAEARARGVKLQFTDFAPPQIPDDQNFAALPMMRKAFAGGMDDNSFKLPERRAKAKPGSNVYSTPEWEPPPLFGDPIKGKKIDWVEWQEYFEEVGFLSEPSDNPASDVLRALEHYAPQFQEWSQWRTRPQCHFPLDLTKGAALPFPHLGLFMNAQKVFSLRMRAHLALGDSVAAEADFVDGLQAYRALRDEPALISGLVRMAVLYPFLNSMGDGLQAHAWKDPELQKIAARLGMLRIWEDYRTALESERGFLNTSSEMSMNASFRERGKKMRSNFEPLQPMPPIVYQLLPRSVFRENQLRMNQYLDELLARIDPAHQVFDPDRKTPSSPENLSGTVDRTYYSLIGESGQMYRNIESRYIRMQTQLDEARLAVALERFRLARGAYPQALAELVPEFIAVLPWDVYASAPYRYQRVGEGSFRLYSVGENRTDDGGMIAPRLSAQKQADEIWLYAPPAAP